MTEHGASVRMVNRPEWRVSVRCKCGLWFTGSGVMRAAAEDMAVIALRRHVNAEKAEEEGVSGESTPSSEDHAERVE